MSDEDPFIRAVLADPDNATARQVYADWLDDRDDPRGEYLRLLPTAAARPPSDPAGIPPLRRVADLRTAHLAEMAAWHAAFIDPWRQQLGLSRVKRLIALTDRREEHIDEDDPPADDPRWADGRGPLWWADSFTPNEPLSGADIAGWEADRGLDLPAEYRLFLTEVGDGGRMAGSYCDFLVFPLGRTSLGSPRAVEPFPVPADALSARLPGLTDRSVDPNWQSPFVELAVDDNGDEPPAGFLWIGHDPSYDHVYLVTNGGLAGTVWNAVGGEWMPETDRRGEPFAFLDWFEYILLDLARVG